MRASSDKRTAIGRRPIISINEARKSLGSAAKSLSDKEIKLLIGDCEQLARLTIRQYLVRKSRVVK